MPLMRRERMDAMITINSDDEIKIPENVAVCPDCKTQLTIYPDGWDLHKDGWVCTSFTHSCATEPEIDDPDYWEWDESHPSFEMPYIYWMPITDDIYRWLEQNYRFAMSEESRCE
jgi:hypothetical protein